MGCKPKKNSLRMADGGEAVTRWAGNQLRMQAGGQVPGLIGGDRLAQQNAATAASSIVKDASQRAGAAAVAGAERGVVNPALVNPAAPKPLGISPTLANPTDRRIAAGTQTTPFRRSRSRRQHWTSGQSRRWYTPPYAQLVGSAYSTIKASAGMSYQGNTSVSYRYENKTINQPLGMTE